MVQIVDDLPLRGRAIGLLPLARGPFDSTMDGDMMPNTQDQRIRKDSGS
jgi:hypothetical protein